MKQILIKQIRFLLFSAALSLCLLFMSAGKANATSYGLTVFDYSVQAGTVTGFHETYLDYNDRAYYYASVDGYLLNYGNDETLRNYQTVDYRFQDNYYDAAVQTFGNVQRGKIYATYSIHSVIARYVYGGGYYQDPDGFSNGYADTQQPTYNFTYGSPVIVGYQRIPVAATGVFVWLPNITGLSVSTANTGATREVEVFGKYIGEHSLINPVVSVSGSGVTVGVTRIVPGEGVVLNVQVADDATPGERQLSLQSGTAPNRVPSNSVPFNVTNNPPNLTSIDVASSLPGASVATSLRGQNLFGQNQSVSVDGTGVTATIRANQQPNEIEILDVTLEIAENASRGDHNITLTVNGRTSNAVVFRVGDRSPIITGISRQEGELGEILGVTITGQNFGLNPLIQFDGTGILPTLQTQSPTEITATFAIGDQTYEGQRGVKVKSFGIAGTGFTTLPGTSDTSNAIPFNVLAGPKVTLPNITSVENQAIRQFTVTTQNMNGVETHLTLENPADTTRGQAAFDAPNPNEIVIPGTPSDQTITIRIKGLVGSKDDDNIKLKAVYGNKNKREDFSVSWVEFLKNDDCAGFDGTEFISNPPTPNPLPYLLVPQIGNNQVKARIAPSGASGDFNLTSPNRNLTVAPNRITSTSSQIVTVTSTNRVTKANYSIDAVANVNGATKASTLVTLVRLRIEKNVVIHAVTEENDDVKGTVRGICVTSGANQVLDTLPTGGDLESTDPMTNLPVIIPGSGGRCHTSPNNRSIPPPSGIPDAASVQDYLNNTTWGRQANIYFTVNRGDDFTVNFDLGRDGKLHYPNAPTNAEIAEELAIRTRLKVPNALDLYYVGMDFDAPNYIAVALGGLDVAFFSQNGLTKYTAAHEIGHLLGRSGHTPTDDVYKNFLMYDTLSLRRPPNVKSESLIGI